MTRRAPPSTRSPPAVAAPLIVEVAEVEVAYIESMVSLPVPAMSPRTSKTVPGEDVPIPTLPHLRAPSPVSMEKIGVVFDEVAIENTFLPWSLTVVVARVDL